jgi:hypothetical protein
VRSSIRFVRLASVVCYSVLRDKPLSVM